MSDEIRDGEIEDPTLPIRQRLMSHQGNLVSVCALCGEAPRYIGEHCRECWGLHVATQDEMERLYAQEDADSRDDDA